MRPLDLLFVIQGEGRGHMSQALALAALVRRAGHDVRAALVGRSGGRDIPAFFRDSIGAPVVSFESPGFTTDADERGVRLLPSVVRGTRRAAAYRRSLRLIERTIARHRPDVVVGFYEPLLGYYYRRRRPAVPMLCVGHQYLVHHADFRFPDGAGRLERAALRRFTAWTAQGAVRRLALSFYPLASSDPGLRVVPPLLRPALFDLPRVRSDGSLLAYILNQGYAEAIAAWQACHPEVEIHGFWDRVPERPVVLQPGLTFHPLSEGAFLERMARCRALVCTAGFESVCEAMYLEKPVLAVPVAGHFEQRCNAVDAVRAGAGVASDRFDIDRLLDFLPRYRPPTAFRAWAAQAEGIFVDEIERAARRGRHAERTRVAAA